MTFRLLFYIALINKLQNNSTFFFLRSVAKIIMIIYSVLQTISSNQDIDISFENHIKIDSTLCDYFKNVFTSFILPSTILYSSFMKHFNRYSFLYLYSFMLTRPYCRYWIWNAMLTLSFVSLCIWFFGHQLPWISVFYAYRSSLKVFLLSLKS